MIDASVLNLQYVIGPSGERNAVIVPIDEFEELLADLADLAVLAERRDKPTISHGELLAELKSNGLISN